MIDLVSVLQKSLEQTGGRTKRKRKIAREKSAARPGKRRSCSHGWPFLRNGASDLCAPKRLQA